MSRRKKKPGISNRAVHGGEREGRPRVSDSLTTPIVQTATYWFRDTQEVIDYQEGRHASFEYGRYGNPTTRVAEQKLRELEEGEACLLAASGMNAVTTLLLALVPEGGRIVTTRDCYRRTRQFISTVLPKMGVETQVIEPSSLSQLEEALDHFERAATFVPDYSVLEINLGIVNSALGRKEVAERHYRRALRLTPDYAQGRYYYADWLKDHGRCPEAIEQLQRAWQQAIPRRLEEG